MNFILGAGLSGLIAAKILGDKWKVIERLPSAFAATHNALLRFKTRGLQEQIPSIILEQVDTIKGVLCDGVISAAPTIRMNNLYSRKVTGRYELRSIYARFEHIQTRYVGDLDIAVKLRDGVDIYYGKEVNSICHRTIFFKDGSSIEYDKVISTLPMPAMLGILKMKSTIQFDSRPIYVSSFFIENCNLNITLYVADESNPVYKFSIIKDCAIVESVDIISESDIEKIVSAIGLGGCGEFRHRLINQCQKFGKIFNTDSRAKKDLIHIMTRDFNVYSLGRFGLWRNIGIDDTVVDIGRIRQLMELAPYDFARSNF